MYTARVEKIGGPKLPPPDPKAKGAPPVLVDFIPETPTINAAPVSADNPDGVEVSINIRYEPSSLGETTAQLVVTSPEGGEYACLLYGTSTAPQP